MPALAWSWTVADVINTGMLSYSQAVFVLAVLLQWATVIFFICFGVYKQCRFQMKKRRHDKMRSGADMRGAYRHWSVLITWLLCILSPSPAVCIQQFATQNLTLTLILTLTLTLTLTQTLTLILTLTRDHWSADRRSRSANCHRSDPPRRSVPLRILSSAQRDANTARALAVVRFGHHPPARRPLQTHKPTDRTDYNTLRRI